MWLLWERDSLLHTSTVYIHILPPSFSCYNLWSLKLLLAFTNYMYCELFCFLVFLSVDTMWKFLTNSVSDPKSVHVYSEKQRQWIKNKQTKSFIINWDDFNTFIAVFQSINVLITIIIVFFSILLPAIVFLPVGK